MARRIVKLVEEKLRPDLKTTLKLAIIGNVIDFSVGYDPARLERDVEEMLKLPLYIDESEELFQELKKAKTLLYLTDNVGEIHFDAIFLRRVREEFAVEIYIAGKEGPIINDATVEDLRRAGLGELGMIISTGTRIVGVPLGEVSEESEGSLRRPT